MSVAIHRFWSVVLGSKAMRLSAWDDRGDEHYAIVPDEGKGSERREKKKKTIDCILAHIEQGFPGGKVGIQEHMASPPSVNGGMTSISRMRHPGAEIRWDNSADRRDT